ncbi:MAG: sulfide-dependent adenosine diphosphate thiazole synthase [Candidatus Fermentibacteraceae bacterium]
MELNEVEISRAIINRYHEKLESCLELDVAIVGGGPSGLVAGYCLARSGLRTALFERKLSIGGGMWGGGMMYNEIVVQPDALELLDEFGIRHREFSPGHHTADSVEAVSCLTSKAMHAGLRVLNCMSVEDVVIREGRVCGLVIIWSPLEMSGLHVDPLSISAKTVIDATGHATEVVEVVQRKAGGELRTPSGSKEGERSMWADRAERLTLENTREVYPGLYVAGMAANATFGGPRMGPIFGGMLLSGRKAARSIMGR